MIMILMMMSFCYPMRSLFHIYMSLSLFLILLGSGSGGGSSGSGDGSSGSASGAGTGGNYSPLEDYSSHKYDNSQHHHHDNNGYLEPIAAVDEVKGEEEVYSNIYDDLGVAPPPPLPRTHHQV